MKDLLFPWRDDPIILTGMHRSGTSLVARIVRELGVFTGASLTENAEAPCYVSMSDWMLRLAHASWDNPLPFDLLVRDRALSDLSANEARKRMRTFGFVRRYIGFGGAALLPSLSSSPWGWKDPRVMVTFPVWRRVYPRAKFVVVFRDPISVALSLSRRETEALSRPLETLLGDKPRYFSVRCRDPREALALWEEYHRSYLNRAHELSEFPVLRVSYEALTSRPEEIIARIADFLGIVASRERISLAANMVDRGQDRNRPAADGSLLAELGGRVEESGVAHDVRALLTGENPRPSS